uniref:Uncharacterized protein n=1 Tax=Ditylenchus dipsaci TaxID=166011 RepID=A0A915D5W3_9BILA
MSRLDLLIKALYEQADHLEYIALSLACKLGILLGAEKDKSMIVPDLNLIDDVDINHDISLRKAQLKESLFTDDSRNHIGTHLQKLLDNRMENCLQTKPTPKKVDPQKDLKRNNTFAVGESSSNKNYRRNNTFASG